jgi:hypothetical protein
MKPSRWLAVSLLLLLLLFLSESWLPAVSIHTSKIRRSNREAERVRLLEQLLQRDPSNLLPGDALYRSYWVAMVSNGEGRWLG